MIRYYFLFFLQVGCLIYCCVKPTKTHWVRQLVFQGLCAAYAFGMTMYYNSLPIPDGLKAPGLYKFAETISSMIATGIFGALLLISLLIALIRWRKNRVNIEIKEELSHENQF